MTAAPAGLLQVFLVLGGSILLGYVGLRLFHRTRVSDLLFLVLGGILAGPVLHLVDPALLHPLAAVLGPLGLAVVLFEGGLELAWEDVRRVAGRAVAFTLTVWIATAGAVAVAAHLVFGFAPVLALLFGIAVAATGVLGAITLLNQIRPPSEARVLLTFEAGIGDLLSAIAVTTISGLLVFQGSVWAGAGLFVMRFAVGAAVGLLAGVAWARGLDRLERRHPFALTLAALLATYAVAEMLLGSGLLAALTFGLVVGNARALVREGGIPLLAAPPHEVRLHQSELLFILRSFYFVYLGIAVSPDSLTPRLLLGGLALAAALVVARVAAGRVATWGWAPARGRTFLLLTGMMPRGLAAAFIAAVPAAMGVPGTESFLTYAFLAIVAADAVTTAAVLVYERQRPEGATADAAAAPEPARVAPGGQT